MAKAIEAIGDWLGRSAAGRALVGAGKAEAERVDARRAARATLDDVAADESRLPALADAAEAAEATYRAEMERLGVELAKARRSYSEAVAALERRRRAAQFIMRDTAPHELTPSGAALTALRAAIGHVGPHTTVEDGRLREVVRDWERAGRHDRGRADVEAMRQRLNLSDRAHACLEALREAIELIERAAAAEVEPDAEALFQELIGDVLPSRCPCGHDFNWSEAFEGPRLAIA